MYNGWTAPVTEYDRIRNLASFLRANVHHDRLAEMFATVRNQSQGDPQKAEEILTSMVRNTLVSQ